MEQLLTTQFWLGLGTIIWVNIILSGDNAVVIALAARSLPPHQQKQAILWGAGAAVVLRIILTIVAVKLLELPFLKLAGAAALLWIAVQLLIPEEDGGGEVESSSHLIGAIKTILIADLVMSTDNVIAVAAVAKDSILLLVLGLVISIPLVIFGGQGDDRIDGGSGGDLIFGDRGRVLYFDPSKPIPARRFGCNVPSSSWIPSSVKSCCCGNTNS